MVQENQRPLYKLVPGRNGQMSKAAAELKPEKPAFVLPVTTITNKQRQGLNLYGRFIQMTGDLGRWRVCTLTDCLPFPFKSAFFYKRAKV